MSVFDDVEYVKSSGRLDILDERTRSIIGSFTDHTTIEDVAAMFSLTRERIRQICSRAAHTTREATRGATR